MQKLWWRTIGDVSKQKLDIVLLHGWGLNSEVWNCVLNELVKYFIIHLVDLPGFGRNYHFKAMCIEDMAKCILQNAPERAIWLGWSLGGLIASYIALTRVDRVQALITVASSPYFIKSYNWPGIKLDIIDNFQQQLNIDFLGTIEKFLFLQSFGLKNIKKNINLFKKSILMLPIPKNKVLSNGLEILKNVDLRQPMSNLLLPHLRIYGYLDGLVPHQISYLLDKYWPQSYSLVIKGAAHAPFISHSLEFCSAVKNFILKVLTL